MTNMDETPRSLPTRCWCCDRDYDDRELVRLDAHPEVGICPACALDLKQRARAREDELRPTAMTRLRAAVRRLRRWIISNDWHNRPLIGAFLRRINRHLP